VAFRSLTPANRTFPGRQISDLIRCHSEQKHSSTLSYPLPRPVIPRKSTVGVGSKT